MTAVPALFVSHGSPMFALESGETGPALRAWGQQLRERHPDLRGVVVMSPHWMTRGVAVMTGPQPETWHDFGGFPQALYALQYPAPGDTALAQQVLDLLTDAGAHPQGDPDRPFDHGAWVPMMHLFSQADLPVVQVSLPAGFSPQQLYAMGAALQPLREQGVLVVASGSMTHNLREFFGGRPALDAPPAPYALEFARWVERAVVEHNHEALFDFADQAPQAARSHPTDEHFVTLFFALGASGWAGDSRPAPHYLSREVMYSILAMDAFAIG